VLVKLSKPGQDLRFDRPAIGPRTIADAHRAGLSAILVEAGTTLLLDRTETVSLARRSGLTLLAIEGSTVPRLEDTLGLQR